ncbi:MAG: hypothetical protein AB1589_33235 [Cyanobacteriota bacterium]
MQFASHLFFDSGDDALTSIDNMFAARGIGRHGYRDATLILLAYRHG